jgi:TonB-linked SusC/RagA family outer membrane protein
MRKFYFLVSFILCSGLINAAYAQTISGDVYDKSTHNPVPGANVITGKSKKAAITDVKGKFTITLDGDAYIEVSHTGYKAQRIAVVSGTTDYQVELEAAASLDQVVVVAYGNQKKANLTGAVTTVDVNKTFGSKPLNDPTRALQGIVPGLTIQYGNGGLTSAADIKLRGIGSINGSSRPLILVDNVQTDDLSIINPQDIESISVLKDAAASSIYGARAAFGVVLIKTRSGRKNQKATISYTNNFSWNKPTILPDFADPEYELQGLNDAAVAAGINPETFGMNLLKLKEGVIKWKQNYAGKNTGLEMVKGEDWNVEPGGKTYFYRVWDPKKEMLAKYTFSQLHNINISGGSEKISYYLSGGYSSDGGIMKMNPDNVKKYNITAGLNASVTDWLDVSVKTMYRNYEYEYPYNYQNYWYYFWRWGAYFPYGTYQGKYFRTNSAYLAGASKANLVDNYQRIDLGATLKLTKKLNIRTDYTISRDNTLRHEAGGPIIAWDFWTVGALNLKDISGSSNAVTYTSGKLMVNTMNTYATYEDKLGENHNIKVLAGINAERDENINFYAARQGLLDPTQAELLNTYGANTSGPSSSSVPAGWSPNGHGKRAFAGYFGRINYNYKEKYLLELNGRYDGSSMFPPQNRWAFFPSVSAGYRLSQEAFMDVIKPIVQDLKLRASYGELGNQDVTTDGTNIYLRNMNGTTQNASPNPLYWLNSSGTWAAGVTQPAAVAQSLKWERINTLDFGLDARILDNHIGLSFDWYERNTKGMIQPTSVAATFGTTGPKINAGNFRTRGYEINIDANYNIGNDIQLYGSVGFTDYKTVFTKWNNPNQSISNAAGVNYVGKTYGEIWGFETAGFYQSLKDSADSPTQKLLQNGNFTYGPGDVKFRDLDGNDTISGGKMTLANHGDLKVIGNTQPRYIYNVRVGGSWKGFDVDIFIQGVGKRSWWGIGNTILPMYQSLDILYANQLDYWTPGNPNAKYPTPYPNNGSGAIAGLSSGGNNFYPQTKYLLNLSYCRLKNVAIGYSLPANLMARYKIQKLRLYVSGENLAEISHVGAPIDPEITDGQSNYTGRTYPFMRSFSFGVQITY